MCMDLELHQRMAAGEPSVCMCVCVGVCGVCVSVRACMRACVCVWMGGRCAQCECAHVCVIK